MRLDSNYVRLHIVQELASTPYAKIRYDDFDVIVVDLPGKRAAAINIMERQMPRHEVLWIYNEHQKYDIHTVFILWCEMLLPEHGDIFEPPDWLQTLHTLHHHKIYAYKTVGDEVYIFPVTFHRIGYGPERLVKYGSLIDVKDLGCAVMEIDGGHLDGSWRIADFAAGRGQAHAERVYKAQYMEEETRRRKFYEQQKRKYQHQHQQTDQQTAIQNLRFMHCRVLGVPPSASWDDIKQAYRDLARQYHPDLNPSKQATQKMQQINEAYTFLMGLRDDGSAA